MDLARSTWMDELAAEIYLRPDHYQHVSVESIDPRFLFEMWERERSRDRVSCRDLVDWAKEHPGMQDFIRNHPKDPLSVELDKYLRRLDSELEVTKGYIETCFKKTPDYEKNHKDESNSPEDLLRKKNGELINDLPQAPKANFVVVGGGHCNTLEKNLAALGYVSSFQTKKIWMVDENTSIGKLLPMPGFKKLHQIPSGLKEEMTKAILELPRLMLQQRN